MRKTHSNLNLLKGKDLSLQQLTKLNSMLDHQQNRATIIGKQMQNQIQLSKKNDKAITKNIQEINHQGQHLAHRYEEQKEKYEKLQFLVSNIEQQIYKAKMDKANDLKNNVQTDQLAQYISVLSDKERELQKNLQKTNTSSYDLAKKLDSIRALRSERTIVSSLFDKIERELCNLEHCYKVLVIQRKRQEDVMAQVVDQFNHCQASAHKEISKLREKSGKLKEKQENDLKINAKINTELQEERRNSKLDLLMVQVVAKSYHSTTELTMKKMRSASKIECDLQKIKRQRLVKDIFNKLGICHIKQLPADVESLQQNNQALLRQSNQLFQKIIEAQENLASISKKAKVSTAPSSRKMKFLHRKTTLTSFASQIQQNRLQLTQFTQICKIVLERIKETHPFQVDSLPPSFLNEEEEIVFYMGQIQQFFQNSYKTPEPTPRQPRQKSQPKFLNTLLHNRQEHNMSIYQQQDLLQFAKKNLQKLDKTDRGCKI